VFIWCEKNESLFSCNTAKNVCVNPFQPILIHLNMYSTTYSRLCLSRLVRSRMYSSTDQAKGRVISVRF